MCGHNGVSKCESNRHYTKRLLCSKQTEDNMQLKTNGQNREYTLQHTEISSSLLGLSSTFGTGVQKVPEMIKIVFATVQETLNGNIRTRVKTCKFVTSNKFQTVEFQNNTLSSYRTSNFSTTSTSNASQMEIHTSMAIIRINLGQRLRKRTRQIFHLSGR